MEKLNAFPTCTTDINKMSVNFHPNFLLGKLIAEKRGDSKIAKLLSFKNLQDKHFLLENIAELKEDFKITLNDVYHSFENEEDMQKLSEMNFFSSDIKKKSTKSKPSPAYKMSMAPSGGDNKKKKKLLEQHSYLFKAKPF